MAGEKESESSVVGVIAAADVRETTIRENILIQRNFQQNLLIAGASANLPYPRIRNGILIPTLFLW